MKKSLALVLTLIMVMGCMSFAAAEGDRTVTDMTSSYPGIQSTYIIEKTEDDKASVQLTYFADDSAWQTDSNNQYISVQAKLAAPSNQANYVQWSSGSRTGDLESVKETGGNKYYIYSYRFDKGRYTFQNLKLECYYTNEEKKTFSTRTILPVLSF